MFQERRRRSLGGWILDDPVECERWLNSLHINADQQRHMGKPTVQVATGHPELDLCLQHHLTGALAELEVSLFGLKGLAWAFESSFKF